MRILSQGDTSEAVCPKCKKLRSLTYRYEKYSLPNRPSHVIENVLQGFCDICNSLAAIPAQSSPKIQREIRKNKKYIEARVPPTLEDILLNVSSIIRVEPQLAFRLLLNFFANEWNQNPKHYFAKMQLLEGKHFLNEKASSRVSSKIDSDSLEVIERVCEKLQLSKSEFLKAVLVMAGLDLMDMQKSPTAKRFYKAASLLGTFGKS